MGIAQLSWKEWICEDLLTKGEGKFAGVVIESKMPPTEGASLWLAPSGKPVSLKALEPLGSGRWGLRIKGASEDLLEATTSVWDYPGFVHRTKSGWFYLTDKRAGRDLAGTKLSFSLPGFTEKWQAFLKPSRELPERVFLAKFDSPVPWLPGLSYESSGGQNLLVALTSTGAFPKGFKDELSQGRLTLNQLYTREMKDLGWVALPSAMETAPWREAYVVGPYRVYRPWFKTIWNKTQRAIRAPGGIAQKELFQSLGIPRGLGEQLILRWEQRGELISKQFFLFPPDGGKDNLSPFARSILRKVVAAGEDGLGGALLRQPGWEGQLKVLERTGQILRLSPDWVISREGVEPLTHKILAALQGNLLDVKEIRELIGVSRSSVMAIMGYLESKKMVRALGPKTWELSK